MKKIILAVLILALNPLHAQRVNTKNLVGTWANDSIINVIKSGSDITALKYFSPQFIYIKPAMSFIFEYRFEQYSTESKLGSFKYEDGIISFRLSGISFRLLNDTTLIGNYFGQKRKYKKIASSYNIGSGMQISFKNSFFNYRQLWGFSKIDSGIIKNSQNVIISNRSIKNEKNDSVLYYFDFISQNKRINGKLCQGFYMFKANNKVQSKGKLFYILKEDNRIVLYDGKELSFIFW